MAMVVKHKPAIKPVQSPVCSVCIANYNGAATLPACIDSVLNQDCQFSVEIIVHDDASTDESIERIQDKYPSIELLIGSINKGYCISNNRMAEIARGKFILLLNNDAELYPDSLQTLYEYAQKQQRQGILSLPQYDRATGANIDYGMDLDPFLNPIPRKAHKKPQVSTVHGACFWIPKNLWEELGGFPEWFESVAEDLYLCVYAWNIAYSVEVPNKSGYLHWVGQSFGGGKAQQNTLVTTYRRRFLSERNKTSIMLLFYPWQAFALLALHFILLLAEGVLLSVFLAKPKVWKSIYWKACIDIIRNRKIIFTKRSDLHKNNILKSKPFFSMIRILPRKLQLLLNYGLPRVSDLTIQSNHNMPD